MAATLRSALVKRGRGRGILCEGIPTLSADVNMVTSTLVVLACEMSKVLTVIGVGCLTLRGWESNALSK